MTWIILNGKRTWTEPALLGDARFSVEVLYDDEGIGHLDHRGAAAAYDDQAIEERKDRERRP